MNLARRYSHSQVLLAFRTEVSHFQFFQGLYIHGLCIHIHINIQLTSESL